MNTILERIKNSSALRGLVLASGVYFFAIASGNAAVVISVTGEASDTEYTLSISGSLTLLNAATGSTDDDVKLPDANGIWQDFGLAGINGPDVVEGQNSFINPILSNNSGATSGFITFTITDTSDNESVLFTQNYTRWEVSLTHFRFEHTLANDSFPTTVDAGDIATFSGSMVLPITNGNDYSTVFHTGTFVDPDGYNGESVTVNIVGATAVPEPSGSLLICCGLSLLVFSRKRGVYRGQR